MSETPLLAVGAVVFRSDGAVLLVQRGRPPMVGAWSLPGGHVQTGEAPPRAIEREVLEETSLVVHAEERVDVVRIEREGYRYEIHEYLCSLASEPSTARAGDDAQGVRWMPVAELAALGVSVETRQVIEKARALPPKGGLPP